MDRARNRITIERVRTAGDDASHAATVISVRAVDMLHASLLPRWDANALDRDQGTENRLDDALNTSYLGLGLTVLAPLQGLGPTLAPMLSMSQAIAPRLWLQLSLMGLASRPQVSRASGVADVTQEMGTLDLKFVVWKQRSLSAFMAGGIGLMHIAVSGKPNFPYMEVNSDTWSGVSTGGLGITFGPVGRVRLNFELWGLLAWRAPQVEILDEPVAKVARPGLGVKTAVELGW